MGYTTERVMAGNETADALAADAAKAAAVPPKIAREVKQTLFLASKVQERIAVTTCLACEASAGREGGFQDDPTVPTEASTPATRGYKAQLERQGHVIQSQGAARLFCSVCKCSASRLQRCHWLSDGACPGRPPSHDDFSRPIRVGTQRLHPTHTLVWKERADGGGGRVPRGLQEGPA